ncbi:class I SAM-dependent methyltransferase [Metasolibacillus sp. FSL H7-0170]|uniref:class I SAM-dependent methyltransferase n=1 Tax=Metasolibacillus TaxID=2703677 RepID=UPI000D3BDEE1|nr:class I SAM-dependent methyltransferase [Metasolibacillus fluoroglycofenilyticus]
MKQNIYDNNKFFQQYKALRARENNYNNLLEQPYFISLVPEVRGKVVLDIGCGMGDFAATCVQQGAKHVTGIDISANMIATAKSNYTYENLIFKQTAFEDLTVPAASIDFISSSLVFHYMADFQQLIKEISLALKSDGILLFSIEHPIVTANKGNDSWITNQAGDIFHFALDNYQDESLRTQHWFVDNVMTYHRTMSTVLNTLIDYGLQIEKIVEPKPTDDAIDKLPSIQKELRRPSFLIVRARKG